MAALTNILPLSYIKVTPGAPIGPDGRVVDTPEVAVAKAEHAAAHVNEKINLANEAIKSADHHVITYSSPIVTADHTQLVHPIATKWISGAPIGPDGRVVDTPEVAIAKAQHAAAHINEKLGQHAANLASHELPVVISPYTAPIVHTYIH